MERAAIAGGVMMAEQHRRLRNRSAHHHRTPKEGRQGSDVIRLRLYALGDHLRSAEAGTGTIVLVSSSAAWSALKLMLVRELFGHFVDPGEIDTANIHVFLLPDGEVIDQTNAIQSNDKVALYVGESPFSGSLEETGNVFAFREQMIRYLLRFERDDREIGATLFRRVQPRVNSARGNRTVQGPVSRPAPFLRRLSMQSNTEHESEHSLVESQPRLRRGSAPAIARAPFSSGTHVSPKHSTMVPTEEAVTTTEGQSGSGKTPAEKREIRRKFRSAIRRLVLLNTLSQLPPVVDHTGMLGGEQSGSGWGFRSRRGRSSFRMARSIDTFIRDQSNIYQYNEQRGDVDDERMPCLMIHPDVSAKLAWDMIILSIVMFFGFAVPYRIGFDVTLSAGETVFDLASDIIFIIDIVLSFRTAYKDDGLLVTNSWLVAKKYLTTWFPIDFMASLPIGWFTDDTGGVNKLFRMLRMFKLFRMLRLLRLFPRFTQVLETNIKFNPSMVRFLRSFAIMLLMWHNIACAYWFIAKEEYGGAVRCPEPFQNVTCWVHHCVCDYTDPDNVMDVQGTDSTWLNPERPDLWVPHYALANSPYSLQYAQAFFWAIMVTTGIGADIIPRSETEVAFTAVMTVVGLMMYSLIIGSASSALANIDSTATQRRQTLDKVTAFMRSRKVPPFFQRIIVDYYEHMWQTPAKEADVFRDLPPSLRSKLSIVMNRDLVDRVAVFRLLQLDAYVRMVERLKHITFLPGEFIADVGQECTGLFFIKRGRVDGILPIRRERSVIFITVRPGDFFGERAILDHTTYTTAFRAVDFLDVLVMSLPDFNELRVTAPLFESEIQRVAAIREKIRLDRELELLREDEAQNEQPSPSGPKLPDALRTGVARVAPLVDDIKGHVAVAAGPSSAVGLAQLDVIDEENSVASRVRSRSTSFSEAPGSTGNSSRSSTSGDGHSKWLAGSLASDQAADDSRSTASTARGPPHVPQLAIVQSRGGELMHLGPAAPPSAGITSQCPQDGGVSGLCPVRASSLSMP